MFVKNKINNKRYNGLKSLKYFFSFVLNEEKITLPKLSTYK